jgi:hypothetical protein
MAASIQPLFNRFASSVCLLALLLLAGGCAQHYIPPSGRADLGQMSKNSSIRESFEMKPAAAFPAGIVAVRVQTSGYENYHTRQSGGVHGRGSFSVVFSKEAGEPEQIERLTGLSDLGGIISLNRMLLPERLESEEAVREAAARLKADMVLLYTFDTKFFDDDKSVFLNVVTLGLSPTRKVNVLVSASALLVDTKTGFIYGALEANEKRRLTSNVWESRETADRARQDAEKAAFKGLVDEFIKAWPAIVKRAKQGA